MANINRDYLVIADLKSGKITSPNMSFYNTDKNIANLFVKLQITMSTNPSIVGFVNKEEASNYNVKLTVVKPKTTMLVELTGVVQDESVMGNGAVYLFDMPQNFTDQVGKYICELEITCMVNGREEIVTCDPFRYTVKASAVTGLNVEIEPNPDIPVLRQLIDEVRYLQENEVSAETFAAYQKITDDKLKQVEIDLNEAVANATNGSESVTNSEIVLARKGKTSLREKIDEFDSQIKDKANLNEVVKKGYGTLNDFDEETRKAILENNNIDINYVLGEGNVKPENTNFICTGKNIFDKNSVVNDIYITNNGVEKEDTTKTLFTSDLMKTEIGEQYTLTEFATHEKWQFIYLIKYGKNKEFISRTDYTTSTIATNGGKLEIIADSEYIRIVSKKSILEFTQIEKGTSSFYEEYELILKDITVKELEDKLKIVEDKIVENSFNSSIYRLAYIKDKKLCCNDSSESRTAKYTGIDLGDGVLPLVMKCKCVWESNLNGGSVAIISNPKGLKTVAGITTKSFHIVFTPTQMTFGLFDNQVNTVKYTKTYNTPCKCDGITEYEFGWYYYQAGNWVEFYYPDGTSERYDVGNISAYFGQYCTWEHYYSSNENIARPMFTQFYLKDSNNFIFTDDFCRGDGAIGNNAYGYQYIQLTNNITLN